MSTIDGRRDILRNIASYRYGSRRTIVTDTDNAVGHFALVNRHGANVTKGESLAHDGNGLSVIVSHLARLCGWKLISNTAHLDIQCLRPCCYRQQ